jgi:predicted enzyme related to lactoylglutathione lyase
VTTVPEITFVHTNLIARDWKRLAAFYIDVFGCAPVPPERHLSGQWIDRLTGIPGVKVDGVHLSLPGQANGPTLEIFQYSPEHAGSAAQAIHRSGFGHIAFHVDDVYAVLACIRQHGGGQLGNVVVKGYEGLGRLTVVYASDPEGNYIEIQNWEKQ